MKLSLVFMTGREDPHLDWVVDGLNEQASKDDEIDLIVVDFYNRPILDLDRRLMFTTNIRTRVVPPMPNIWQGQYRVTRSDFWATSSCRNTAIVLAEHDYIAFLDDRCHLGPKWFETVRRYEAERISVLVGSYEKREDGDLTSHDHRRQMFPNGKIHCAPGWLYGCSFALPLEWALEVNGFEDGTNGLTGEDYLFGEMLANADHTLDFVPDMFVSQDRSHGNVTCKGIFTCMDKGVSPNDKSHAALARFGARSRTEFTPDLRALRALRAKQGSWFRFPVPDPTLEYRDWFDDEDIRTM